MAEPTPFQVLKQKINDIIRTKPVIEERTDVSWLAMDPNSKTKMKDSFNRGLASISAAVKDGEKLSLSPINIQHMPISEMLKQAQAMKAVLVAINSNSLIHMIVYNTKTIEKRYPSHQLLVSTMCEILTTQLKSPAYLTSTTLTLTQLTSPNLVIKEILDDYQQLIQSASNKIQAYIAATTQSPDIPNQDIITIVESLKQIYVVADTLGIPSSAIAIHMISAIEGVFQRCNTVVLGQYNVWGHECISRQIDPHQHIMELAQALKAKPPAGSIIAQPPPTSNFQIIDNIAAANYFNANPLNFPTFPRGPPTYQNQRPNNTNQRYANPSNQRAYYNQPFTPNQQFGNFNQQQQQHQNHNHRNQQHQQSSQQNSNSKPRHRNPNASNNRTPANHNQHRGSSNSQSAVNSANSHTRTKKFYNKNGVNNKSNKYLPSYFSANTAISYNDDIDDVFANSATQAYISKDGIFDTGCNRTVTPLEQEMKNKRSSNMKVQGYQVGHQQSTSTAGTLSDLPAIYDENARHTLFATRDVIDKANVNIIFAKGMMYMVDVFDATAWIDKMKRSDRIVYQVTEDKHGLFRMPVPESFVREPTDHTLEKMGIKQTVSWAKSDSNSIGGGSNSIGADMRATVAEANLATVVEEGNLDEILQALMAETETAIEESQASLVQMIDKLGSDRCDVIEANYVKFNFDAFATNMEKERQWIKEWLDDKMVEVREIHINYSNTIKDAERRMHKIMGHYNDMASLFGHAKLPKEMLNDQGKNPFHKCNRKDRRKKVFSHEGVWCDVCQFQKAQNPTMGSGPYPMPPDLEAMSELYIDAMSKTGQKGPLDISYMWLITDRKTGMIFLMGSSDKSDHGDFILRLTSFLRKWNPYIGDPDKNKIKGLHYDGDGVFSSAVFQSLLEKFHIKPMPVPSRQHFLNGMVERKIQSIRIMANSYRREYDVPSLFQFFAVEFACWAWNRLVHSGQTITPYEQLYGEQPNLEHAFVPFCKAYILTYDPNKEQPVARPGFFIGYTKDAPHQRTYDVAYYTEKPGRDGRPAGRLEIIRNRYNVTFNEDQGFGDLYPHLADTQKNQMLQMVNTNHGEKMKWIEAAYNKIKQINVDGQSVLQPHRDNQGVTTHILDREQVEEQYIPPDADFSNNVQEPVPVVQPINNAATSENTPLSPPHILKLSYPHKCSCGHPTPFKKPRPLLRHWRKKCSKFKPHFDRFNESQMSSDNVQPAPQNPDVQHSEREASSSSSDGIIAVVEIEPLPSFVAEESMNIEPILEQYTDGSLKRASSPVQEVDEMDIDDSDSGSRASNNESSSGGNGKRRWKRRRRTSSPIDPLEERRVNDSQSDHNPSPKATKKAKRGFKGMEAVLSNPFQQGSVKFVDRRRTSKKKDKYNRGNQININNLIETTHYNTRSRKTPQANLCTYSAFSAIYSHADDDDQHHHKKRAPPPYDEMRPPKTLEEIYQRPDKELWLEPVRIELAKHVGKKIDADPNRVPTFHKVTAADNYDPATDKMYHLVWRFDIKSKFNTATGKLEITKRKCRIAVDGSTDIEDVDYDARYGSSKVVNAITTRILLSMAARYRLKAAQFDVAGAYLYGMLPSNRRVFIRAPKMVDDPELGVTDIKPGDLCRIDTALYGLPDSSGYWAEKLLKEIKNINKTLGTNFATLDEDPCVLVHRKPRSGMDDEIIIIPIYVDDLRCYYNNDKLYKQVIAELHKVFELDDRTDDEVYLGMSVKREGSTGAFYLNCETLISKVLNKYDLINLQDRDVPMIERSASTKNAIKLPKDKYKIFRSILGAISFVAYSCRPDISYATNKIARHQSDPDHRDMDDLLYLLGYLKGTKDKGIKITGEWNHETSNNFTVYTDASFSDVAESMHSTFGYAAYLGGDLIYWTSTTTKTVCRSSAESELYAIDKAVMSTIIPQTKLLQELHISSSFPPMIRCDNQAALDVLNTDKYVKRLKHTRIQIAFLRQEKQGHIDEETGIRQTSTFQTKHIGTKDNGADIFTKILSPTVFPTTRNLVYHNRWGHRINQQSK